MSQRSDNDLQSIIDQCVNSVKRGLHPELASKKATERLLAWRDKAKAKELSRCYVDNDGTIYVKTATGFMEQSDRVAQLKGDSNE